MSSEWKAKRFWTDVSVVTEGDGFAVELDGRRVKTPAKETLLLPTHEMARAVAVEWDAQHGVINPVGMPFTRSANAAIDKVRHQHGEVAEMLAGYGDTDLLCYRAKSPKDLVLRQTEEWNPALEWASDKLGARLAVHDGVIHRPQSPDDLARLSAKVHVLTDFQLAAFHDLVSLSGSLVLGFAAAMGWRAADAIWQMSQLDENWQIEKWGTDDEAKALTEVKRQAFLHAKRFYDLS